MKAVAFNGSPRAKGNTYDMIMRVFSRLEPRGIDCSLIQVGGKLIQGCRACGTCKKNKDKKCTFDNDLVNDSLRKMEEVDVILLGSPTYFASLTPEMKALIDRCGYVSRANGSILRHKIGASVVAVRRAGAMNVFQAINNFFFINEMVQPGASYWNLTLSRDIGDFASDDEGVATMDTLGDNIAWLLEKLKG